MKKAPSKVASGEKMTPLARCANSVSVLFLGAGLYGCAAAMSATANAEAVAPPKAAAPKAAAPKAAVAAPKPNDHQVRTMIARMVENQRLFRSLLVDSGAPKLKDPKIVGPREHTTTTGKKIITYCVSAVVDTLVGFFPKSAGITIEKLQDGRTRFQMSVPTYTYEECTGPNVEPFPELQRLRDMRRRELGKTS